MHPATAVPAPPPQGSTPRCSLRRWLRRVTAGTTTAAVVLLAAPAVVPTERGGGSASAPAPGPAGVGGAAEPAGPVDAVAGDPGPVDAVDDLRLVGHRKPHPYRTIKRYRVRPGDTPSGIAVRYHAWTAQLLRINHTSTLYAGEVIRVPVVTRVARECTRHRRHRTNVGRPHPSKPAKQAKAAKAAKHGKKAAKHAKPTKKKAGHKKHAHKNSRAPHRVRHARGWHHRGASRAEVRRVIVKKARRFDVNPALALAVSWQESGWQHDRVSSAGAKGAMQIMPGTGRWMSAMVGRRLNIKDLHDNVTAGVVLLRLLRDEAGPRVAVAGYYQGLSGVRRHGMYDSTKRYVANVHALRKRIEKGWSPV